MAHPALLHSHSVLPSTSPARGRRHCASQPAPLFPGSRRRRRNRPALRPMASSTAQAPPGLKEGIAGLYDESSGVWESIWGDHMHHGFYDSGEAASIADHRRAQIRMIEEALAFAAVPDDPAKRPKTIVDVGCGIGGSSRYLAKKYGAQCNGITLSPVQAERGNAIAEDQGLSDKPLLNVYCHPGVTKQSRFLSKSLTLWSNRFLMGSLILFGPWRVASTCRTNESLLASWHASRLLERQ